MAFTYTDPLGNECQGEFDVRSTFFPFSAEYINTSLFSQGTYDEQTHTFRPGQWGQMGWEYPNGADMSAYKYLVLKLDAPSSGSHLNIFTANSIWSDCYATSDFGQRKQIVVSLKNAQYTSGDKTGQPMDTKNIRIVAFWGNGNQDIKVNDIYLTNNNDFSPSGIEALHLQPSESRVIHDLQGRRVNSPNPHKGIYIVNGKKHGVK